MESNKFSGLLIYLGVVSVPILIFILAGGNVSDHAVFIFEYYFVLYLLPASWVLYGDKGKKEVERKAEENINRDKRREDALRLLESFNSYFTPDEFKYMRSYVLWMADDRITSPTSRTAQVRTSDVECYLKYRWDRIKKDYPEQYRTLTGMEMVRMY